MSSAGPYVPAFEERFSRYCNVRYGVACSSGTAALHLAFAALGIGPGDEVIVPCFNLIVGASTVLWTGARPVLVDAEPEHGCLDPAKIRKKITPKTKAILAVHIYGHPCDMDPILKIARSCGLKVIEDAAEAHGAEYKGRKVGAIGHVGCFSFYGNKTIVAGEGGMLVSDNPRVAERARLLRNQAFEEPRFVHRFLGFNYRLSNLQAALGLAQCEKIEEKVSKKRLIAAWYAEELAGESGVTLPGQAAWARHAWWMYGILVSPDFGCSRDRLMQMLRKRGVETRPFFHPIHRQPVFLHQSSPRFRFVRERYPVAERLGRQGLYLPSGLNLRRRDVSRVAAAIRECRRQAR